MRTRIRRARVAALAALLVALAVFLNSVGSASPPSSTAQDGFSYLLWARDTTARIWVLDANGGLVREHVLSWPVRGEVYAPRELMMGPDGTRRLLWTNAESGRSVAWLLDDAFNVVGERVYQAANPAMNWYTTNLEKNGDGSGRLLWFNGQVGTAVLWGLDAADTKVSTKYYTPAADLGAWVPIEYSKALDGSARLVWTYVWNGTGPWGGKAVVWFLDQNDTKIGSQVIPYEADWFLRTYHFGNDGKLRFLIANDLQSKGKVCTALTDTTVVPSAEGWGVGKCKTFGPEAGWILRSYTGNLPLDLSAHERAMVERESQRLGFPKERFVSPTEVRFEDYVVPTSQLDPDPPDGNPGSLTTLTVQRWPLGRMYLKFPPDVSLNFIQNTLADCQAWASAAGVSCLSGNLAPRLEIQVASGPACFSNSIGVRAGGNVVTTDENGYCAAHEIGHALGLIHTHQREDRDGYVRIHLENAIPEFHYALIDRNRVLPYGFGPYDFYSVMHYGAYDFALPFIPARPTITRLDGGASMGGFGYLSNLDRQEMQRLYPGLGTVSPAQEFINPPDPPQTPQLFVSYVTISGQLYTPVAMPPVRPGDVFSMVVVVTNSGPKWLASDHYSLHVTASGDITLSGSASMPVNHDVASGGAFGVPFVVQVPATAQPSAARLDIELRDVNGVALASDPLYLYISSPGAGLPSPTGSAQLLSVGAQVNVVPVGGMVPFQVRVQNPSSHPETVRVRGYVGGAGVTDPQATFQVRTIEPGQTDTFSYSVVAPPSPGIVKVYGQLYTLVGTQPYNGNESGDVQVVNPPACGGCNFSGIPCGQEGRCVNDPTLGCGFSNVCGAPCQENAEVQQVTTTPNPVPPNAPFTVTARVKNLSTQVNTFSVRAYTNLAGVAPADAWRNDQAMQPLETRNFGFTFNAPASGSFQSFGQVFCPGAPLPFVGNASLPATVGGGGGGPYTGVVPSASIAYVGPQPASAGGSISLYARVHNHNNYTTSFYLRPYATAPVFQELPRFSVSIPPNTDVTEHIVFAVPNQPGTALDLHFQVEYTVGQALSGASATGIPIGAVGPSPSPTPPPENICPGPNDGDSTGCPVDGAGHQTYRTCQSCRSAYPAAPGCQLKQQLNWCWKPQ